jgi:hypothetical protein
MNVESILKKAIVDSRIVALLRKILLFYLATVRFATILSTRATLPFSHNNKNGKLLSLKLSLTFK